MFTRSMSRLRSGLVNFSLRIPPETCTCARPRAQRNLRDSLGFLLLLYRFNFFFELLDFLVALADVVNLSDKIFQARLDDFVRDLFFVEERPVL